MRDVSPTPTPLEKLDPAESWAPWEPSADDPWDRKWAGHLYRRAAFGASWPELQAALDDGPEATIDRLLDGGEGRDEFDRLMDALAPETDRSSSPRAAHDIALQGWWLHRMIHTSHPLRERMTLFWHNHFATSILKVRQPALMAQQNVLIRTARPRQVRAVPPGDEPRPGHADLARLQQQRPGPAERELRPRADGAVLPRRRPLHRVRRPRGRPRLHRLAHRRAEVHPQPAPARRRQEDRARPDRRPGTATTSSGSSSSSRRRPDSSSASSTAHFVSEGETPSRPPARAPWPTATARRATTPPTSLRTMLRSRLFFSDHAFRQRVKSPVEYVVGLLRGLEAKPSESHGMAMGGGSGNSLGN